MNGCINCWITRHRFGKALIDASEHKVMAQFLYHVCTDQGAEYSSMARHTNACPWIQTYTSLSVLPEPLPRARRATGSYSSAFSGPLLASKKALSHCMNSRLSWYLPLTSFCTGTTYSSAQDTARSVTIGVVYGASNYFCCCAVYKKVHLSAFALSNIYTWFSCWWCTL